MSKGTEVDSLVLLLGCFWWKQVGEPGFQAGDKRETLGNCGQDSELESYFRKIGLAVLQKGRWVATSISPA